MNHTTNLIARLSACLLLLVGLGIMATAENNQAALDTQAPDPQGKGGYTRILSLQKPMLSGADVKTLQSRLISLGYSELGEADGYFGGKTDMALKRFQRWNGLFPNGVFGKLTQTHLYADNAVDGKTPANHGPLVCVATPNYYLGAFSAKSGWIDAEKSVLELPTSQQWTLLGSLQAGQPILKKDWPASVVAADPLQEGPCAWLNELQSIQKLPEFSIATTASWNPVPRPAKIVAPAQFPGLPALSNLAKQHGTTLGAGNLSQVVMVDLDGDGNQEYVAVAAKGTDPSMGRKAGDYTLVVEFKPAVGNIAAQLLVIAETWHAEDIDGFNGNGLDQEIKAVFDADGDGVLDLLCDYHAYEAFGSVLFTKRNGAWKPVVSEGCGV